MKKKKANPYDPIYIMKRDNCSHEEALKYISQLKEKNAWNRGKTIKKANPYDPLYIMKRDNCSHEEAIQFIDKYKRDKATSLPNFIKKYGKIDGTQMYNEWKNKSLGKGWTIARRNGASQSKFSPLYYIRHGYSPEEAHIMAIEWQHKTSPLHVEYYISRGKSLDYARKSIRKLHDKKIGIDGYRVYLEKITDMTTKEIDIKIKQVRGNCTLINLGEKEFNRRMDKMRKTFEDKGLWIPFEDMSDYQLYHREVWKHTNKQDLRLLEHYGCRGLAGVDGAYHLDHKFSICRGYIDGIASNIIGSISNLEFITWEENVKKQSRCSITIEELLNEN